MRRCRRWLVPGLHPGVLIRCICIYIYTCAPILENYMEKKMVNEMETGVYRGGRSRLSEVFGRAGN